MIRREELNLTQEWDKTFKKSEKVDHSKVTFVNRYGITLAADMYVPKNAEGKLPAIAVCGPFGAVKEQCSGLYAQTMAERGFLTIAFDPFPEIIHSLPSEIADLFASLFLMLLQPCLISGIGFCFILPELYHQLAAIGRNAADRVPAG